MRQEWIATIEEYQKALVILCSKKDLSDEEIFAFQRHINVFFQTWVRLSGGRSGMTNYIHMLVSGHISEYLFKWRNLWVHSQQGWEALNSLIKTFFLRRTGRGSAGKGEKSRLRPIARWFQRRMIWMCAYSLADCKRELELAQANNTTIADIAINDILDQDDEADMHLGMI